MVEESDMKLLPRRTQLERDNTATAIAGSIASAIRFLVKQIVTEQEDLVIYQTIHSFWPIMESLRLFVLKCATPNPYSTETF